MNVSTYDLFFILALTQLIPDPALPPNRPSWKQCPKAENTLPVTSTYNPKRRGVLRKR
jgi:hypothetical protein